MTDDPRVEKILKIVKEICNDKKCQYNKSGRSPLCCGKKKIEMCGITKEAAEVFARTNKVMILRRKNE